MRAWLVIAILIFASSVEAGSPTDSLLRELDKLLAKRDVFVQRKADRINVLKVQLSKTNPEAQYHLISTICEEYKTFVYDSAAIYVRKLLKMAHGSRDLSKIAHARVKQGFILLSSGMFNEALDSLLVVNIHPASDSIKIEYYSVLARAYFDLIDFNSDDYFTEKYTRLGLQYIDSAIRLCRQIL